MVQILKKFGTLKEVMLTTTKKSVRNESGEGVLRWFLGVLR